MNRIAILLLYCVALANAKPTPRGVKLSLAAKWPSTPLLHEAAEFLVRIRFLYGSYYTNSNTNTNNA